MMYLMRSLRALFLSAAGARLEEIYDLLALKRPDNPKRSLAYFIGAVQGRKEGGTSGLKPL